MKHPWIASTSLVLWTRLLWSVVLAASSSSGVTAQEHFSSPLKLQASNSPRTLNVHIVPHTHDDVGWLKTVEEYYFGLNNTIQDVCVQDILDTTVAALAEHPYRTFTYVEMKFFSMWWDRQTPAVKDTVRYLVANKQLSFANGGWCMHDEASTHYMGMVDQTTLGHDFLLQELGVVPKVGWQLDPFGHSATQASLMTHKAGFDALYFGRIDYQDLQLRLESQQCEGFWNASDNSDSTVFWGLTGSYHGNYGGPFCFDVHCDRDSLIDMDQATLKAKLLNFLQQMKIQSDQTLGQHILLTMGSDFQYQRASVNFANLDLLMSAIQDFSKWNMFNISSIFGPRFDRLNMFYSNPEYYTKCKFDELKEQQSSHRTSSTLLPYNTKEDDFFPYADCPHCFWTGYFTSRTSLKRMERVSSSFLMAARQWAVFAGSDNNNGKCLSALRMLEDAVGVVQHHDGVSGTAKQHVANDYARRLHAGMDAVREMCLEGAVQVAYQQNNAAGNGRNSNIPFHYCHLLNETQCAVSEELTTGTDLYVVVYNSLAQPRNVAVRLPTSHSGDFLVSRMDGQKVPTVSSAYVTPNLPHQCRDTTCTQWMLAFDTGKLPPLGSAIFRVQVHKPSLRPTAMHKLVDTATSATSRRLVQWSKDTIPEVQVASASLELPWAQRWGYYESYDASQDSKDPSKDSMNSGAYIFRPRKSDLQQITPAASKSVTTPVGIEIHTTFDVPWLSTVTRLLDNEEYIEVEYTLGPISIKDGRGKEIVTRFQAPDLHNAGMFYTDSNGREFIQRQVDHRPTWNLTVTEPVAGNYYPVNAAIYIQDSKASMAVLTDRSQGGTSLQDGIIELMVQRRTLKDDFRGVGEPMNETSGGVTPYPPYGDATRYGEGIVIRGRHRILIGGGNKGAALARSEMDSAFAEPLVFVGPSTSSEPPSFRVHNTSGLILGLPPNVKLVTLAPWRHSNDGTDDATRTLLLRLGHQYDRDDDSDLSKPVDVDLAKLLNGMEVLSITEKTLSGNRDHAVWLKDRLDWSFGRETASPSVDGTIVRLQPMGIVTMVVKVKSSKQ